MDSLAGRLLVSTPEITDGVFERSVVLLLAQLRLDAIPQLIDVIF